MLTEHVKKASCAGFHRTDNKNKIFRIAIDNFSQLAGNI